MMNGLMAREDFDNAVGVFQRAFPDVPNVIHAFKLTQSELRLEQPLTANNTLYTFPVMDNILSQNGTIFNTEIRLRMQDIFVPTYISICLGNPSSTTDTTFRLYSYPNQFVFANALQMRALYNGQLKIQTDNYQYIYGWGLQRHWMSAQTQQTAAFGAGSPEDQNDWSTDSFFPMQPFVLFSGSANVQVNIVLPAAPTAVDANSRYVMRLYGVLAQMATPIN